MILDTLILAGVGLAIGAAWLADRIHRRIHETSEDMILKRCFEEKRRVFERQREQVLNASNSEWEKGDRKAGAQLAREVRDIDNKLLALAEEESTALLDTSPVDLAKYQGKP